MYICIIVAVCEELISYDYCATKHLVQFIYVQ